MFSIRSFLSIVTIAGGLCFCLQAQAQSYVYDFSYAFGSGIVVDGSFLGDIDQTNTDRLINIRRVSAAYTLPGGTRTEINGGETLVVTYPSAWSDRAYMSFSGKWNDFGFHDGSTDGSGATTAFSILGGYQVATFALYPEGGIVSEWFDTHAVDPLTGAVPGWRVALAPVPEPHALVMNVVGLGVLIAVLRARVRRAAIRRSAAVAAARL